MRKIPARHNPRKNFRRDTAFPRGTHCVEAKELSLTRKTRAQPWKYYIHHLFYLASIFRLTFFLLWQVRNYSLLENPVVRTKREGRKEKGTKRPRTCAWNIVLSVARLALNRILCCRYLLRLHMWCKDRKWVVLSAKCAVASGNEES